MKKSLLSLALAVAIPAAISGTGSAVNIPVANATPVTVVDTIVKPVSVVGQVTTKASSQN